MFKHEWQINEWTGIQIRSCILIHTSIKKYTSYSGLKQHYQSTKQINLKAKLIHIHTTSVKK